jgi:catechol 2,3-dioxygenase-like lactoylglutathione lyase family enzyme
MRTEEVAVPDIGLTHVALTCTDPEASASFYETYAGMRIVHRRPSDHHERDVLWISDGTRPFVIVLLPGDRIEHRLGAMNHLGVGCASRDEVDALLQQARDEGRTVLGPLDYGPPVGYWGMIEDPDGHNLELAYGQEVGLTVDDAADGSDGSDEPVA